ncbi:hypothetical protein, partial [Beijerinckia sp. L45]|uniref:hypothetical protein n=1 Tax=Beijerinckia sp. L45 TaxID=1641855 RepID=UPI00131EB568
MELLSDADLGIQTATPTADPTSTGGGVDSSSFLPGERAITVTRGPAPTPPPQQPVVPSSGGGAPGAASPAPADDASSQPKLLSDADLGIGASTPNGDGILSNAPDDSYTTGALKGLGTAAVKALGDSVGFVGGLSNFADYLVARAQSKITGEPVENALAKIAAAKQAQQQHASSEGIPAFTDPRNALPAPDAISAPILKVTGEYKPTTEPGRIAQGAAEAALAGIGPGVGARAAPYAEVLAAAPAMALGNAAA